MNEIQIPDRGVDRDPSKRPGVPMETPPRRLSGAADLPPVFGTAQPARGLSGLIRRAAYRVPDHRPHRWMMLLLADRVDAVEHGARRGPAMGLAIGLGALLAGACVAARRR